MPQTNTAWDTSDKDNVSMPAYTESYVRMLYRLEEHKAPVDYNYIGFQSAKSHAGYDESQLKAEGYEGPLYVLVGYSFSSTWISGKGYVYNIPVPGNTGGRLLDEYLYDEYGRRTDLKTPGGLITDPLIPDDDEIRLYPIVSNWDDNTSGADIDDR